MTHKMNERSTSTYPRQFSSNPIIRSCHNWGEDSTVVLQIGKKNKIINKIKKRPLYTSDIPYSTYSLSKMSDNNSECISITSWYGNSLTYHFQKVFLDRVKK